VQTPKVPNRGKILPANFGSITTTSIHANHDVLHPKFADLRQSNDKVTLRTRGELSDILKALASAQAKYHDHNNNNQRDATADHVENVHSSKENI